MVVASERSGTSCDHVGFASVPDVAVRWMVHDTSTNIDLASLSNVCRRWREIVAQCVVDSMESKINEGDRLYSLPSTFSCLLLPSMLRYFDVSRTKTKEGHNEHDNLDQEIDEDETYCVAWFHPDGIKFWQLSLVNPEDEISGNEEDTEDGLVSHTTESTKPYSQHGRSKGLIDTIDHRKYLFTPSNSRLNQVSAALSLPTSCPASENIMDWGASVLYQWNGYSEAIDILQPFGYSHFLLRLANDWNPNHRVSLGFGKRIYEKLQLKSISLGIPGEREERTVLPPSAPWVFPSKCDEISYSSYAVRGATRARPEGYCECWDQDNFEFSPPDFCLLGEKETEAQARTPKRVLWSKNDDEGMLQKAGILRPCIQFLNIDSTHAVRLFTEKFERPVYTPLTIFCVAIATEDGCLFSGLREKLEMGHMHPTELQNDVNDERSPICINADYIERKTHGSEQNDVEHKIQVKKKSQRDDKFLGSDCNCFSSFIADCNDDESTEDEDEYCANIVRGELGPGMWHCYVAVFDGEQSVIRIDGEEEKSCYASDIPTTFQACLDGITIGSDHGFDMSLCFGEGSDGEGEGAISELVFFKGHMQLPDIRCLESHLMGKHGILPPEKPRKERLHDDYYSRLAHSLMDQHPTSAHRDLKGDERRIPLRFMTKLRHVAWERTNTVTGRRVSVQRIGDKWRKGSMSQW